MKTFTMAGTLAATMAALGLGVAAQTTPAPKKPAVARASQPAPAKPAMAVAHKADAPQAAAAPVPDLTKQYCTGCHSEKGKAGGLSLVAFDPSHADQQAEVAENVCTSAMLS